MAILSPFVGIWAGEQYVLNFWIVFVFCLNIYIEGMMTPAWTFRTTMGLFSHGKFLPLVAAFINLGVSIWWAKAYGLIGVLLGTTFTKLCTGVWPAPYIIFHHGWAKRPFAYYAKWFANLLVVVIDIGLVRLIDNLLHLQGVLAVFAYGIASVVIFLLSVFLVYGKSYEFRYAIQVKNNLFGKVFKKYAQH